MFNFASKLINTIGDLVSIEEPPKPQQQSLQTQQRCASGEIRNFPQKSYSGLTSDENTFKIPNTGRETKSPTAIYHYPSEASGSTSYGPITSSTTYGSHNTTYGSSSTAYGPATTSYGQSTTFGATTQNYRLPERYEDAKFKTQNVNYNGDGYNTAGNARHTFTTEVQKEYGMYKEHDVNDASDFQEEDRYSPNYVQTTRKRSLNNRENSQLKNISECNDNALYTNVDRNYYDSRPDQQHMLPGTDAEFYLTESYDSSGNIEKCKFNTNEIAQFGETNMWVNEDEYHQTRWKNDENSFENEDKMLPSPPLQDDDAKNSSRSESESSDEISFGEALATGLISPEMAARMNIELMNHPKAMIESFYGHSPGEVYTIPEEEDEICSPTGADGVTSLRKQRMASARVEKSVNIPCDLQNQKRTISMNQTEPKLKYGVLSTESNDNFNQCSCTEDSKGIRVIEEENENPNKGQTIQSNLSQKYQSDQNNSKQLFQQKLQQQFKAAQMSQYERQENRVQTQQPISDPRTQINVENNPQQMCRQDIRNNAPYFTENRQLQGYINENKQNKQSSTYLPDKFSQQSNTDNRIPQAFFFDNRQSQGYCDVRQMQPGIASDNRVQQPVHFNQFSHDRTSQQIYTNDNRQRTYPTDSRQFHSTNDNRQILSSYTNDNRTSQSLKVENRPPQNVYYTDTRQPTYIIETPLHQPGSTSDTHHQSMYMGDIRPSQGFMADNRQILPEQKIDKPFQREYSNDNYQHQQAYQNDVKQTQLGYDVERSQQGYLSDNRPQSGLFSSEKKEQEYYSDNRSVMQGYPLNRQSHQGYPADRSGQQIYCDTVPNQQGFSQNQASIGYLQKGYPASEYRKPNQQLQYSSNELPQKPPSNQRYYQDQQQFGNRDQSNEDRRSQNFRSTEFQCQNYRGRRRQLPERQDILPDQTVRKKLPLRKYNSEEKHECFQQEYERQRSNSQSYEDAEDEYNHEERYQRTKYDKTRYRSTSLDSYERNVQYHSRSRSSSMDRAQEDQETEIQPRRITEPKKTMQRGIQFDEQDFQKKSSTKHVQNQPRTSVMDKTRKSTQLIDNDVINNEEKLQKFDKRHHITSKESKKIVEASPRSRLPVEIKKGENFCPQHKKFTSNVNTTTRPTRRMLPKEPVGGQSGIKKNVKRQTQDKNTVISKSIENAYQKSGILSNAARKVERSGNLKITFSDPISNLLKPNKARASITRADHSIKSASTKSDKCVVSSDVISQSSKNFVYAFAKDKQPNSLEISPSLLPAVSPLHRNQSLDIALKDNRLSTSPNARSLPVPIINRARSLDRYSSSDTNLNVSPYFKDQFLRPGSAPGLMYEPIQQPTNHALQLSLYEMHALKKEERFWADIYSALPTDMKHLIANRGIGGTTIGKLFNNNVNFSTPSSPAQVIGANHSIDRTSLENKITQRGTISKQTSNVNRDNVTSSLGERIGNRLRMLHEMKQQTGAFGNRRKSAADVLSRRSASDGEYSFSSATNFPLYWNLARRPHSDSAIDLLERLETPNPPTRMSGSAYNSSEFLTMDSGYFRVIDKSQSYLTSPLSNVPPSPTPIQPIHLRDTALRGDHIESTNVTRNSHPGADNRSGFFSCLQNIESLTRQYEEEDRIRTELDPYEDEIYSDSGIPSSEYGRSDLHSSHRKHFKDHPNCKRNNQL